MSGKKEIDIEVLLQLTFGWELLKDPSAPPPLASGFAAILRHAELMPHLVSDGRPDSSSWPFLDYKLGGPHPDARVVKAAVDALPAKSVALLWPEDRHLLAPDLDTAADAANECPVR